MIECDDTGSHLSRGVLVKFQTTKGDVQAVEQAAKDYRGDNKGFYSSLEGNNLRKYMREPSTFRKKKGGEKKQIQCMK